MTAHLHRLAGCTPTPLASYLKSLAVLRLIAEQKDVEARGFFRDGIFHLVTSLEAEALSRFFVEEYTPTPIITPWNGGSGFYPKDADAGIQAIEASTTDRLSAYRASIVLARVIVGDRRSAPKKDEKLVLLGACRAALEGPALEWLNAAVALGGDGDGRTAFPALLGTGGNDGRLDFANNFMQRIAALLLEGGGERTIEHALFGSPARGLDKGAVGQFFPGGAGGVNAANGFTGSSVFDAWDFVLMLEGAIAFAVAAVRRLDGTAPAQLSGPFTLRASAAGYASATVAEQAPRGEQWMPIWSKPATYREVRALFAEGRMRCGKAAAERPVDAARSLSRFGIARGIQSFQRYGYIERNGRSNFAVPLGNWPVVEQPDVDLLEEVDGWVDQLRRAAGREAAPASLARDVRTIESAMLDVCRDARAPAHWERLLVALGSAEAGLLARRKATKDLRLSPLPRLSPAWLRVIARPEGDAELRLAAAIASQVTPGDSERAVASRLGTIRCHCLPLAREGQASRFQTAGDGLALDPRVVWRGRHLVTDLVAVAMRRSIEAAEAHLPGLGLVGRLKARLDDVEAFIAARTDDSRIARLARPLMAVDYARSAERNSAVGHWYEVARSASPLPSYALVRAAHAAELPKGCELRLVRSDPAVLRRLSSGDLAGAATAALVRLRAMGARPRVHRMGGSAALARRLAASLVIPIDARDLGRAFDAVCKPPTEE